MSDFSYQYNLVQFKNKIVSVDRLTQEIQSSEITIVLDYINTYNSYVDIFFKAELPTNDKLLLDGIVANHSGELLPEESPIVRTEVLTEHMQYVEAGTTTQGLFACESIVVDVASGDTIKIVDVSWKFNTALKTGTLPVSQDMVGDELIIEIGSNTLIGAVAIPVNPGDDTIYVSPTVLQNIKVGYYLDLYPSQTELGRVIQVNTNNIKLDRTVSSALSPGTYLSMTVKIIPYLYFSTPTTIDIGKTMPTGNRIPANVKIRIKYYNNNGKAKKMSFFVEYLF